MEHKTYQTTSFWPDLNSAVAYARSHNLFRYPDLRFMPYPHGVAIQQYRDGPFWCAIACPPGWK